MRYCAVLAAMTMVAVSARAAPPPDADPRLVPWFNGLRAPWTNALCCSAADCRPVDSRLRQGQYEVFVGGAWRNVPAITILNRSDNPTGRAVVCWTPHAGVMCFVPPPQS